MIFSSGRLTFYIDLKSIASLGYLKQELLYDNMVNLTKRINISGKESMTWLERLIE